ncbi:hypothetical protein GCM10012286_00320 [Streptomyces lasiicapitis]|uniref:Uncharacterized protein n=1 Tax=Streptomyces lasiicapitis TaxID=1923961 RepID=A0ABQ2LHJ4_9ACTN|nr:hypothetical protein GCM10012286_00320 [Streptomyces lasiicapitis]
MARIADAYWRFEKRFSRPPTRSQRFSARHPVLIGTYAGVAMSAVLLPASLGAGNGVAYSILVSLLGGVPLGAVFCGFCFLERKRQQKLFGDR